MSINSIPETLEFPVEGMTCAACSARLQKRLDALDGVLRAAGGEPRNVVKVQVFLTDIADRARINPVRERYFGEHRPASTLVEVSALVDPRMKVEIEAVAVID